MKGQPKRRGRPTKTAPPDGRVPIGLRISAQMKRRLDKAAALSGRSLSQEIELRIERAIDFESLYGGPEMTALVNIMAGAFVRGGYEVAKKMGVGKRTPDEWMQHPECYAAAMLAVHETLFTYRPDGELMAAMQNATDKVLDILEAHGAKVSRPRNDEKRGKS